MMVYMAASKFINKSSYKTMISMLKTIIRKMVIKVVLSSAFIFPNLKFEYSLPREKFRHNYSLKKMSITMMLLKHLIRALNSHPYVEQPSFPYQLVPE